MHRWPLLCAVLCAPIASADLEACHEKHQDCADDCSLSHGGSVRLESRKKLEKCLRTCNHTHDTCVEREQELKRNLLDNTALDKEPSGRRDEARRKAAEAWERQPAPAPTPEVAADAGAAPSDAGVSTPAEKEVTKAPASSAPDAGAQPFFIPKRRVSP